MSQRNFKQAFECLFFSLEYARERRVNKAIKQVALIEDASNA